MNSMFVGGTTLSFECDMFHHIIERRLGYKVLFFCEVSY